MTKRFLLIILMLAVLISTCSFAPSPRYRLYGASTIVTDGDYNPSTLRAGGSPTVGAGPLPSYYSSKDLGYTTGVENQGGTQLCWAFGHNELLEINLAKKYGVKYDFSEEAMKFETSYQQEPTYGFLRSPNAGGNGYISTAYLARTGSVLEEDEPFSADTETRSVDGKALARVGRLSSVPMFENSVNSNCELNQDQVDHIKTLIMEYGAVCASIRFNTGSPYLNYDRVGYFYNGPAFGPNHMVTVVGWDDSFPASGFSQQPAGDGAFIVKNSYGLYHDNGTSDYFYISYYDKYVCSDYFVTDYETDTSLYDNISQYDYMGWVDNAIATGSTITAINRFVAKSPGERLTAVSTYIAAPDTLVEVMVCTGGDFRKESSYRTVANKVIDASGYFVIPVKETVIPEYEYYVALRITVQDSSVSFPIQTNCELVDCAAALPNIGVIGTSFADLIPIARAVDDDSATLCIKAFTKNAEQSALPASVFTDVKAGGWYEEAVCYATGAGLFNGTSKTTFSPQTVMTRAMFVRVLANLSGVDFSEYGGYTGYIDVPSGKWYSAAVLWASENNIVNGTTPNTFSPEEPVSRQQMCVMLLRYAKSLGFKFGEDPGDFRFEDDEQIQDYAKEAVYVCRLYGIINGVTPTAFSPRNDATRAQVATLFKNFCTGILF